MAKSKTQPEEVVEAEAEDFITADGATDSGNVTEGEAPAPLPPVPAGGNEPGVLPPSMR